MNLKKNFLKVLNVNIIVLIIGVITAFFIPKLLNLEAYAILKKYQWIFSYTGVLSLGFVDGIYLKYGGKSKYEIDESIMKLENYFFLIFSIIVSILILIISIVFKNKYILYFSLGLMPFNMIGYMNMFYQSIGDFMNYSKLNYTIQIVGFIINFLLILTKTSNPYMYIYWNIIQCFIIFIIFEIKFILEFKNFKINKYKKYIIKNFKIGIFILLGNFLANLFYSIDRVFITSFLKIEEFAYYSFAISIVGMINLLINTVTMVFYPYFTQKKDMNERLKIKKYAIIIGAIFSSSYFGFALIINMFLKKYIYSLNIIAILFVGFPAMIVIRVIYVNLYKAEKKEKLYFKTILTVLVISIILDGISLYIYMSSVSIAIATTIVFYIWYVYSTKHFIYLKTTRDEVYFLFLTGSGFLICSNLLDVLRGILLYVILLCVSIRVIYFKEIKQLMKLVLSKK